MKNAGFILEDLVAHDAWVRALARRLLTDENTAEDIAQNAMMAALERPPRKRAAVRAWLGRVVRNLVFMENRTLARRRLRERRAARSELLPSVEELAGRFGQSGTLHTVYAYDSTDEYSMYSASGKTIDVLKSLADRGGGSFVFLDEQSCETLVLEGMQVPLFGKRIGEGPAPARRGDWRCRYIRKKVQDRDFAWLVRTFARRCPPRVVEALVEIDDPWVLEVLRKMTANPHLPGRVRAAAEYVLIRKSFRKR